MGLKHVVLAVLVHAPAHGYEIHQRVMETLPVARPCDSSRVYAILGVLRREGWIEGRAEPLARGRVRTRYRLTEEGARALRAWLERPRAASTLLRRGFLLRLAYAGGLARDEARAVWTRAVGSVERRRERTATSAPDEDPLARLLRVRELGQLDVELRAAREMLDRAADEVSCSRQPSPASPPFRTDRSSASR